ncbi:hypothetical protein BDY21DRAFT_281088 [Lineolata rhizophorae]|uniref:Meiotically up-regulated protein Msb1/Mug8 domain-containing protein n=1 Tax=Lineolata rhizophorae TaxID=578093 RepID=A0A6A6P811_9PEZI|nr:hypothetical protein BDY21DRAFT_281088 [Lineolata rhizophorae]
MPFFSRVFRNRDGAAAAAKTKKHAEPVEAEPAPPPKPRWEDSWSRKSVPPEEIAELVHVCTQEMKSRALDMPLLLLPFRPDSDPTSARHFIRSYFKSLYEGGWQHRGEALHQELRLTEPIVLCSIMKWCWSRIPGGVVGWDVYELFKIGEQDSNMARHAFDTFIPLSADSEARKQIIFDFFDLLAAVAARGKTNGLGGRKLSRLAGWWAFEHVDSGNGFDGGYKSWTNAADATSHLFFAFLRSLTPDSVSGISGIASLPRSLQALLSQTEYPPETPVLMQTTTPKVVMIVDSVSPTPFALLRRAKHFEYRDEDWALQQYSAYDDPVNALTDECRRVLGCIASTNQSSTGIPHGSVNKSGDASWSRFEDFGFNGLLDRPTQPKEGNGLRTTPRARTNDLGRPTTPSWADFLSTGFADDRASPEPARFLLPPDKVLPPISDSRVHSSQSHLRLGDQEDLEPGELASITTLELDETFWWVWMTSLAGEEPSERKAVFGRCALIETQISGGRWLIMEEQVKGASPGPEEGAHIVEKKSRFSFTRRGRLGRRKSTGKKTPTPTIQEPYDRNNTSTPMSKTSIAPDQHARIQAAAAQLAQQQRAQKEPDTQAQRRARTDDQASVKTSSVLTLQPAILSEAAPAMKWARQWESKGDKEATRARYLADKNAGKGSSTVNLNGSSTPTHTPANGDAKRDLPALPNETTEPEAVKKEHKSLPPAPMPTTPTIHTPQREEISEAVEVPLPSPGDEKHIFPREPAEQHPAFRQSGPHVEPTAPETQSQAQDELIPDAGPSKKPSPKKLQKPVTAGTGFKKIFGKKKAEPKAEPKVEPQAKPVSNGDADHSLLSPQGAVGRRMSILGKKSSAHTEDHSTTASAAPSVVATTEASTGPSTAIPDHTDAPLAVSENRPAISRINTDEQREANTEFSRFDQGPLDDIPAFVPHDSPEPSPRQPSPQLDYELTPTPMTPADPHVADVPDDDSEASVEAAAPQVSPQDRWAQIRKNAAERAAARGSEEQSRRSHSQSQSARTDEGETSGEETIESRVARIKARVAELTGNADGQGGVPRR